MNVSLKNVSSPYLKAPTNLSVAAGIHGIIGPNAVGKTTLLRLIAGHHRPRTGTVTTGSTALSHVGSNTCFAGHRIHDHFAVARVGHPLFDEALASEVLNIAALKPASKFSELSVGQRQLVSVATALAVNAEATLLDEPFNGLDVRARNTIRALLIRLADERPAWTLLLSSHRSEDLAGLVSDVIPLHQSQVGEPVDLDEVRAEYPTLIGPMQLVRNIAGTHQAVEEAALGPSCG